MPEAYRVPSPEADITYLVGKAQDMKLRPQHRGNTVGVGGVKCLAANVKDRHPRDLLKGPL